MTDFPPLYSKNLNSSLPPSLSGFQHGAWKIHKKNLEMIRYVHTFTLNNVVVSLCRQCALGFKRSVVFEGWGEGAQMDEEINKQIN